MRKGFSKEFEFCSLCASFILFLLVIAIEKATAVTSDEHHFEEVIRSIKSRGISCFVSHAWGRTEQEREQDDRFVARLEQSLDLLIDTYYDARTDERGARGGISLPRFMGNIGTTNFILMVFTPALKQKYEEGHSAIVTEVDYVIANVLNKQQEKFIPVLFSGDRRTSFPILLSHLKYYDFTDSMIYQDQLLKVLGHMLPSCTVELDQLKGSLIPKVLTPPVVAETKPSSILRVDAKSSLTISKVKSKKRRIETDQRLSIVEEKSIERPMCVLIPDIAIGNEEIYRRFVNKGKLIFKPNKDNDVGRVEIPFSSLSNPLEGAFDLSNQSTFGNIGKYLSIATGHRKEMAANNVGKVEVWIVLRFLVEKYLTTTAQHLCPIMNEFTSSVGVFWTYGNWDNMNWYDYLIVQNLDDLSNGENLYMKPRATTRQRRPQDPIPPLPADIAAGIALSSILIEI